MTHIITAAWRTYLRLNTAANRAYDAHMVELDATVPTAPKTDCHKGRGTGICERCGIDSTDLRRQKCSPCTAYLRRRNNPAATPRDCPQCATTHTDHSRVCSTCRVRNHRDRKATT